MIPFTCCTVLPVLHLNTCITVICAVLSNLEEFQEARFGGTRLPHHCHCSAEVVHILAVGIQHHGLWKLLRNTEVLTHLPFAGTLLHHMISHSLGRHKQTLILYYPADSGVRSDNFRWCCCGGQRHKECCWLIQRWVWKQYSCKKRFQIWVFNDLHH